jgi:ATP-dependent exoDNAse (exonuclease V) beta subunit
MSKALTVYKASAGSGKTFTLAVEYIRLLVENPQSYRNILAVTFTNKATEEMKMRILSQLYGIWKQLPDSDDYLQRLLVLTGLPDQIISQRAGEALHLLLHNYNYFRVETIDTFFQSVLRNLARELDLTANLRIGLNDIQVEEQAVDQLIDSLTHQDVIFQWLLSYIMETISDDRSWNIIGQVKQFGRTIFRDYYKEENNALNDRIGQKGFLEAYAKQMRQIRNDAKEHMEHIAKRFFEELEAEHIDVIDLSYGKTGIYGFFIKLSSGQFDESIVGKRVTDCMEDASKWYSKKHERAELIHMLAESTLIPLLRQAIEERPRQYRLYKSADLTLRHLNQLRLLEHIERKVRLMNDEANRFLLSDTQQLLHALIKDSDSPFIFEKIGSQLEHVMIDEFQDTSTVQWHNFKVLLQECMSHVGSHNLIVGDVKQSIYRWRSGDWRLLNAIDTEFPHSTETMDIKPLETNYRSERHIIEFNNAFFTEAARLEYEDQNENYPQGASQLHHAYADVAQKIPVKRGLNGYVDIRLLPQKDYQQKTLQQLIEAVASLMAHGVDSKEIAILVRTNHYIPLIADYFAQNMPEARIVSDEAFRLDASTAVCLLIQALHLLTHPDDMLARATVAKMYQGALDAPLPEAFTEHISELLQMPLYELVEKLYSIFHLERLNDQSAYICAFYDQLNQFTQDNSTDIDAFIREWEDTICSKTIQSSETDGIRILSIHKSKGLEFDHVIIPFCDWRLEHADILWCRPQVEPFNALPIVPVDYSQKQMMGTIYEGAYLDEHLQNTVDNLNLLYVAFTRAAKSLYVIGRREAKNTRSALIETVLQNLTLEGYTLDGLDNEDDPISFRFGHFAANNEQIRRKKPSDNVFLQPVTPTTATINSFDAKTEFRQSNKSRDFIEGDDEGQDLSYIKIGSVLHNIFSTIRTTADIEQALLQLQQDGILYNDEVTREKVTGMLRKRLEDKRVNNWFSEHWDVFNECSIIFMENGKLIERRPDRVITDGQETHVIDFKFGSPHEEYHEQVQQYMQLLTDMGLPEVHGWLWYVYSNRIEEVRRR